MKKTEEREAKKEKKERKKKRKEDKARRDKKKRRKLEKAAKDPSTYPRARGYVNTSLRSLDWLWRDRQKQYRETEAKLETAAEYKARKSIPLHPKFVRAGIVHQRPRMHTLARDQDFPDEAPGRVYDPPRRRHSDQQYAQFCGRLMNCLQGPARLFATCEFFYSDIDRAWYNENPFAKAASELGIPKKAKLTRREWAAARRRMGKDKPRRFSEKFIVSQLSDRNEYRSTVRKLQNNPHLSCTEHFPFVVYAPSRAGTMVTAYSKRFRIIQRGRVLTYDRKTALYLIEFENGQFGYELCPDSDVATCGVPTVLMRPSKREEFGTMLGSTTGPAPGAGLVPAESITAKENCVQTMGFIPVGSSGKKRSGSNKNGSKKKDEHAALLEEVADYDSFLTLMEVIDAGRKRKLELLVLIEDASALMVNRLPFGDGGETPELSSETKEHVAWLKANLEQTNAVLSTATDYLRILYGETYLPAQ